RSVKAAGRFPRGAVGGKLRKRSRGRAHPVLSGWLGVTLVSFTAFAACVVARAGDPSAGRERARQCQTCHGIDGLGRLPNVPNLAGQNEMYLAKQLRAFRSGERQAAQMSLIAASLTDEEIDNLAAWYSSIDISVKVPE
ncbi:MAG: cytochrome c, partial [Ectothiorhodospiraceae bacterium]